VLAPHNTSYSAGPGKFTCRSVRYPSPGINCRVGNYSRLDGAKLAEVRDVPLYREDGTASLVTFPAPQPGAEIEHFAIR
jgi:hypothetical protein